MPVPSAARRASPWHHELAGPVWKETAKDPFVDGDAKVSDPRVLRSRGAASVAPNQPPSVPVRRSPCVPSAGNVGVVATGTAVAVKLAGAHPWVPSSKSKSV